MRVAYHDLVARDVAEILEYYSRISPILAEQFQREIDEVIITAAANPRRFHSAGQFRRANLPRFPYHILYEATGDVLKVMVVRHNRRHPNIGLHRR